MYKHAKPGDFPRIPGEIGFHLDVRCALGEESQLSRDANGLTFGTTSVRRRKQRFEASTWGELRFNLGSQDKLELTEAHQSHLEREPAADQNIGPDKPISNECADQPEIRLLLRKCHCFGEINTHRRVKRVYQFAHRFRRRDQ